MNYIHHIPGRMRVRAAGAKRDPRRARALADWLRTLEGVESAEVNPVTGSVLVHYDVARTSGDRLMAQLLERKWLCERAPATPARRSAAPHRHSKNRLAGAVLRWAAEAAIERSVVALVAAVL